jgi:hypothetical protein
MSTIAATNLKNASSGSNNIVLNTDGTTTIAAPSNIIKSGTAVASTSGTAIDFTSIPSWVKRVTVMFSGVSTSGASNLLVRVGDSTGVSATGYQSAVSGIVSTTAGIGSSTSGYLIGGDGASNAIIGDVIITNVTGNTWMASYVLYVNNLQVNQGAGAKTLSGTLDRLRITTVNGTDTFDAGTINLLWEG